MRVAHGYVQEPEASAVEALLMYETNWGINSTICRKLGYTALQRQYCVQLTGVEPTPSL